MQSIIFVIDDFPFKLLFVSLVFCMLYYYLCSMRMINTYKHKGKLVRSNSKNIDINLKNCLFLLDQQ